MKEAGEQIYLKYNTFLFSIKSSNNNYKKRITIFNMQKYMKRLTEEALTNNYYIHAFIHEAWLSTLK